MLLVLAFAPLKLRAQTLVIDGATLIDGTGRPPVPDSVVVVEGSRIVAAGPRGQVAIPPNAQVIRAEGRALLPGLIDAHIHFLDFMPQMFLRFGVTSVFDTANPTEWILATRDALNSGRIKGPRMFATGWVIDGPLATSNLNHATEIGGYKTHVENAEEARAEARRLIALGVNALKVHEGLPTELLAVVTGEAQKAGLQVVGHAEDARESVLEGGMRFLEHHRAVTHSTVRGEPARNVPEADMDPALFDPLIQILVSNNVYYNPTVSRSILHLLSKEREWSELGLQYLEDPAFRFIPEPRRQYWVRAARNLPPASVRSEREAVGRRNVEEFIRRFVNAGGKVLTGPDVAGTSGPSNLPGLAMHIEMEALVDAGLTPMQVIQASTQWSAEFLGQDRDLGTVEPGKLADLLLIEGDPLADIRNTRNIRTVILDGKIVDTTLDPNFRSPLPRPVTGGNPLEYMGPAVSRISPVIARQGDSAVTLEITGEKFTPRSMVRFDTAEVSTRFVSPTRLNATISADLLRNAGTFAVTVITPGSGGGTSNVIYFVVNFRD
jgi:imidazolonepropionase-like amidohydrolase